MTYHIACRVSGGVTGTRESLLKSDGQIKTFATEAEARSCATALNVTMNNPYSTAWFQYWPVAAYEEGS